MADIKLNANGDIDITNTKMSLTDDDNGESLVQRLRIRLQTFKGEWRYNEDFGTPYLQEILVKGATKSKVDVILKNQITSTPGVISLLEYSSEIDSQTRSLSVTFKVLSDTGAQTIQLLI